MNSKTLGFAGAALLIVGLFLPIATMPFLGSVTLMSYGFSVVASGLLVLGLLSGFLVWADRRDALIWTGGGALLTVIYLFGRLQWSMTSMRSELTEGLKDNPFAGLAQTAMASVGLQWGWLVLAAGPAVMVYVAVQERKSEGSPLFAVNDVVERVAAGLSVLVLLIAPAQGAWSYFSAPKVAVSAAGSAPTSATSTPAEASSVPSAEEANYINSSLRLYEFEAKHFDSLLDERVPGVDFKIKNEGGRTINSLTVKVVFFDASDKPIAEEVFYPVNVGEYSTGNEAKPLRPNYIWQQESGQFYTAKSVPSEWKEGNAKATITEVKFAPGN